MNDDQTMPVEGTEEKKEGMEGMPEADGVMPESGETKEDDEEAM